MNISKILFGGISNKCNFLLKNWIHTSFRIVPNLRKSLSFSSEPFTKKSYLGCEKPQLFAFGKIPLLNQFSAANFSQLCVPRAALLSKPLEASGVQNAVQARSLIKWSLDKGKKIGDRNVILRFKRLDWGIWIRPKAGAYKKLWKKKSKRLNRSHQNVFCSASQSKKLDIMVTSFWRRKRVYPDDPYEPYMKREDFFLTRKAPQDYPPRD